MGTGTDSVNADKKIVYPTVNDKGWFRKIQKFEDDGTTVEYSIFNNVSSYQETDKDGKKTTHVEQNNKEGTSLSSFLLDCLGDSKGDIKVIGTKDADNIVTNGKGYLVYGNGGNDNIDMNTEYSNVITNGNEKVNFNGDGNNLVDNKHLGEGLLNRNTYSCDINKLKKVTLENMNKPENQQLLDGINELDRPDILNHINNNVTSNGKDNNLLLISPYEANIKSIGRETHGNVIA